MPSSSTSDRRNKGRKGLLSAHPGLKEKLQRSPLSEAVTAYKLSIGEPAVTRKSAMADVLKAARAKLAEVGTPPEELSVLEQIELEFRPTGPKKRGPKSRPVTERGGKLAARISALVHVLYSECGSQKVAASRAAQLLGLPIEKDVVILRMYRNIRRKGKSQVYGLEARKLFSQLVEILEVPPLAPLSGQEKAQKISEIIIRHTDDLDRKVR